ncbi:hypothetical protein KC19_12G065300 [Ceratodon purpureus]|uniref:Uncharacterized protein n=1 Tax=Ceratodon purpureus TaxID=3225 RepID=A0A8T0G5F2_CERPU|nr:hypothetical protein KC19_12G065300 [Ceratodon purpureus]
MICKRGLRFVGPRQGVVKVRERCAVQCKLSLRAATHVCEENKIRDHMSVDTSGKAVSNVPDFAYSNWVQLSGMSGTETSMATYSRPEPESRTYAKEIVAKDWILVSIHKE